MGTFFDRIGHRSVVGISSRDRMDSIARDTDGGVGWPGSHVVVLRIGWDGSGRPDGALFSTGSGFGVGAEGLALVDDALWPGGHVDRSRITTTIDCLWARGRGVTGSLAGIDAGDGWGDAVVG